jgi:hypothetical protein
MDGGFASGSWEGRPPCRRVLLGGTTSVSSGTDAGEADITNSRQRILDFHVISKLLAVDTEVDPPQQNRRHIRHRVVFPW